MDRADVSVMAAALQQHAPALRYLEGRGLTMETLVKAEIGYVPRGGKYGDSLSIPYFDAQDRVRQVRYRSMNPRAKVKYLSPKGSGRHLYNVGVVDEPILAICEGEFDSLIVRQFLGIPAVAVPGTLTWQREWRWLFRNCDLVYVVMDQDTTEERAGQRALAKITAQVGTVTDVYPITLPEGKDVNDLFLSDPNALKELFA